MSRGSNYSTSALGHRGTGVGNHDRGWVHYNPPVGDSNGRPAFSRWDFNTANTAIGAAAAQRGSVWIACTRYTPNREWICSNNCAETQLNGSMPGRNGCTSRSGEHNWRCRSTWTPAATRKSLYYDKSGRITQISYHAF